LLTHLQLALQRYFFHWFPPSFTYVGAQIPEWQTAERLRIVYQVFCTCALGSLVTSNGQVHRLD